MSYIGDNAYLQHTKNTESFNLCKIEIAYGYGKNKQIRFSKIFLNTLELDKKKRAINRLINFYDAKFPESEPIKLGIEIVGYDVNNPIELTIYKTVYFKNCDFGIPGHIHPFFKKVNKYGIDFRYRAMQKLAKLYESNAENKNLRFKARYLTQHGKVTKHFYNITYFTKNNKVNILANKRRGLKASLTKKY